MTSIWGFRKGAFLVPYRMHEQALADLPEGVRLKISVDLDRNGKFSSLYHVMLGKVADAVNRGPATTSIDDLKKWVKLRQGYYDVVPLPTPGPGGETVAIEYKSTSFKSMGDREFHDFAIASCELIADQLAPWIKQAPEWADIREMLLSILPKDGVSYASIN